MTKAERAEANRKLFVKRTQQLHHAHTQLLNKQYFIHRYKSLPKEQRKELTLDKYITQHPMEQRLKLRFSLDFLRAQVTAALDVKNCPYCGDQLTIKNFSLDHAIPVTRRAEDGLGELLEQFVPIDSPTIDEWPQWTGKDGRPWRLDVGLLLAAFSWDNIVICCYACNKQKGEMWSKDFWILQEALKGMTEKSVAYVRRQLGMMAHWHGAKTEAAPQ